MSKNKSQPNYPRLFHIGTQRAASTFLYNLLLGHPAASLHQRSEVNFFSVEFNRGLNWYLAGFLGKQNRIDTSPKYFMLGQTVAPRIKAYAQKHLGADQPLFLIILRNPIDYLYSHWQMQLKQGFLKVDSQPKSLLAFVRERPGYLRRAFYWQILKGHWLKYFSAAQFKIIIFEDFIKDYSRAVKEILAFWHLPPAQLASRQISQNKIPKYRFLVKIRSKIIKNQKLKNYLKQSRAANFVYSRFLTQSPSQQKLPAGEREELKNIFLTDVRHLEEFLGKKITAWRDFQ